MLGKVSHGSKEWWKIGKEIVSLIPEFSKAIVAETEQRADLTSVSSEDLEKRELLKNASVGDFVKALLDHKSVTGASAEVRAAFGCTGEYEIPLELFEQSDKQKAVTPAPPTGDRPVNVGPVQPFVYQRTVAGFLGIDMPVVSGGEQGYPVLTTQVPFISKIQRCCCR